MRFCVAKISNHPDPFHFSLEGHAFCGGHLRPRRRGCKELHESYSAQAALIAAALMAAVAGGLLPVTKSKTG